MPDDLRQRYAAAILSDFYEPHEIKESAHYGGSVFAAVDRILAVRDEELERLRAQLPQCNGLCLRASDVLDDLSRVAGNPVARAHRSCPLHGDLEAAAWELDVALGKVEAERDGWRERAETAETELETARRELAEAESAIARVRRLCRITIDASCRVQAIDQARDTLTVLDLPPESR